FRSRLTKAVERARLPDGFVLHDLRHRRATTWLADGQNVVHVKEALGHSDLRTTMGYTHLAKEHLRALVQDESRTGESRSQAS
ncbi:MAG: tyrosine-type recombinase/integrase, partial [Gemmatimonadetes bacterium]|nr:tyrosine-type recombinase/integrase [Gemmatimonadota bacterium]